ncbi:hypothetical protein [Lichenifustis flavocetrariae]|uniref:Acylphosphatase n=1 Tax=Lichenifustis flavocetrariae TaxID=2949735 RepID=A0AA41YTN0_9HYPH|nr:hypothetical protein [Lichenifustis flavocetrariae]MCW6507016.1 hypothetical protein [Lichenifustis flavocetrariae]
MREAATIKFSGTLDPARFCEFLDHRARRLDLDTRLDGVGSEAVTVTVEGEPDLIDAFEMACSLGPANCLVREVERCAPALSRDAT